MHAPCGPRWLVTTTKLGFRGEGVVESRIQVMVFGRFEIGRELGRGGMGVVYEAVQKELGRSVALKLLPRERLGDHQHEAAFRSEAQAAARVRHPGLVEIHDAGVEAGQPYIVMELVRGQTLADLVKGGPLDPRRAGFLVAQIAGAVAALHAHGIVHRDLKPGNVLIDASDRAKVTDFGLALVKGEIGEPGRLVGTPGWMAPEQVDSRFGPVGNHTDVWALGAILHWTLTSRSPHATEDPLELVFAVVERTVPSLRSLRPELPAELAAIAEKCLEREPGRRYAAAAGVAKDLQSYLAAEGISIGLPSPLRTALNWARSHAALALNLAMCLLLWSVAWIDLLVARVIDLRFFGIVTSVAVACVIASFALDVARRRWPASAWPHTLWVLFAACAIGTVPVIGDGPSSALVPAFPVVIAGSALWRRESTVWLAMAVTIVIYLCIVAHAELSDSPFRRPLAGYAVMVMTLTSIGFIAARSVRRMRLIADLAAHFHERSS